MINFLKFAGENMKTDKEEPLRIKLYLQIMESSLVSMIIVLKTP